MVVICNILVSIAAMVILYSWTHWGIPEGLEQQSSKPAEVLKVLYKATVFAESGSTVNMRAEPDTNSNKVARVAIG